MVKFKSFAPGWSLSPRRVPPRVSRPPRNATCVFFKDRSNYLLLKLKGTAAGGFGNLFKAILYKSAEDRYSIRVWDADETLLATATVSDGVASLPALVAGTSNLKNVVTCTVVGTIPGTTDFSAGTGIANATSFSGGSR